MENEKNLSPKYEGYNLKNQLLRGEIGLLEFRSKILELDQSSPDRKNALENLNLLSSPDLAEYINNQDESIKKGFLRLKGFTEFHVFQIKAGQNDPNAVNILEQALEDYEAGKDEHSESFTNYIKGTLLYMQGQEIKNEILEKVKEENNLKILKRMNSGLKTRGFPSYSEDYFGI